MRVEQIDLVDAAIEELTQIRGHVGASIYCSGNPQPFVGQYERIDLNTVRVVSGLAVSIIDIDSIVAVTLN